VKSKVTFVLIFVASSVVAQQESALRRWTASNGATVEAEWVAVNDGVVILKKSDGSRVAIQKSQLSKEDRDFVGRKEDESQLQKLPVGHEAKLVNMTLMRGEIHITLIGKEQKGSFLLFVAFGMSTADLTPTVNGLGDFIKEGLIDNLSVSINKKTAAFQTRTVEFNGTSTTVTVPLPSSVKGLGSATAQLFREVGGKHVPVSNAAKTSVIMTGK